MEETATFFKRKEKKYLVGPEEFLRLKTILSDPAENFKTDHLHKDTEFTFIENTYFDSPDLMSYHESLKGEENRFKLRIRRYSQNFKRDNDTVYFEVKSKENGETLKKRVAFKSEWLEEFLKSGSYPKADFVLLNFDKKPQKSLKILNYIIQLLKSLNFRPVLESSYVRYAYRLEGSDSIRITIDRDLKYKSLIDDLEISLPYQEKISQNQVVVEVKYLDEQKLLQIPNLMGLLGESNKFSKYCFGIYQEHLGKQKQRISSPERSKKEKIIYPIQFQAVR